MSLMAMCSMAAQAQSTMEWALVEPESGETVLMSRVGFLLAADNDNVFSVVCNDGRVMGGVRAVSFEQVDISGIKAVEAVGEVQLPGGSVDGQLRLTGCREGVQVAVYDGGGRQVRSLVSDGRGTVVDVTGLPSGVYVLRAGDVSVKFMKR